MLGYYDEYNRPLSHEEVFRRASVRMGTPQVFDDRGDLVSRQVILDDVGWRFGTAGARAAKAAGRATSFTVGAIGCVLPIVVMPLLIVVMINVHVYRPALVLVMALGAMTFLQLLRESPPRITALMALLVTLGMGFWVMYHYLPYPQLEPKTWQQWFIDPPIDPFPAAFFLPTFVWYLVLVRAVYTLVGDDSWITMAVMLFLALLPGVLIQDGGDPLTAQASWREPVLRYFPETPLDKQARLAQEKQTALSTPVAGATAAATLEPPRPTPTPFVIQIASTGDPAYLYRMPKLDDRVNVPYPAWTRLTIARSEIIQGDGVEWLQVRAIDGSVGYLPRQFAAPAQ